MRGRAAERGRERQERSEGNASVLKSYIALIGLPFRVVSGSCRWDGSSRQASGSQCPAGQPEIPPKPGVPMHVFAEALLVILFAAPAAAQTTTATTPAPTPAPLSERPPTRADVLRGSYGRYRA